jgi:TolB protein
LLFTSNRDGSPQVYQYRFADQVIRRLTFVGRYNARASWLPNGKGFILLHQTSSGFVLASSQLSDNKLQVFSPPGKIESPSMAPNGQMVLYTRHDARGHAVLARISLDGLVRLTVPVQSGEVLSTAWSPFVGDTAS